MSSAITQPARRVEEGSSHRGLALFVISCAQLMIILDATIVNVALPTIHRALHFSESSLEWVITAYALTFGGLLLFGGRTGDLFGRRRMFMVGVGVFAVASLLGGFATTEGWLIVTRGLQGVGGAIASPTALSLIATNFPEGRERNRALGVYAMMSAGGGAAGLLLGGILTSYVSWRWIFFVNVPIGALALLLAPRALKESDTTKGRLDAVGAVTVTAGMISLVYGLTNASTHSWSSIGTIVPLVLAGVLLVAFVVLEGRHPQPLMPLSIFASRNRSGAYVIMLFLGTAVFSLLFFLTQYLQNVHLYSAVRTGLAFLPMTVGIMVAATISSRLITRIGIRPPLLLGPAMVVGALVWLTRLTPTSGYQSLIGPLVILALGMGQSFVPLTVTAVSGVAPRETGLASALLNTSQQIGGALGLAVLGTVAISATEHQLAASTHPATHAAREAAVTYGYTRALIVAAVLAFVGWLVSVIVLRPAGAVPVPAEGVVDDLAEAAP